MSSSKLAKSMAPATWIAIKPDVSAALGCLTRRLDSLEDQDIRRAALVEQVREYLARGAGAKSQDRDRGQVRKAVVVKSPLEVEDTAWQHKVVELIHTLRRNGCEQVAGEIEHRLAKIRGSVPPKPDAMSDDAEDQFGAELAHYRSRRETEEEAVRWLVDYLRAVKGDAEREASPTGVAEDTDSNEFHEEAQGPTGPRNLMGVSLQAIATHIRKDDPEGQKRLVKKWLNKKGKRTDPLPDPIGTESGELRHRQRRLYEPSAILAFLKKVEGERVVTDFGLNRVIYATLREAGPISDSR